MLKRIISDEQIINVRVTTQLSALVHNIIAYSWNIKEFFILLCVCVCVCERERELLYVWFR